MPDPFGNPLDFEDPWDWVPDIEDQMTCCEIGDDGLMCGEIAAWCDAEMDLAYCAKHDPARAAIGRDS